MIFWLSLNAFRSCLTTKLHLERYEVLVILCVVAFNVSKYLASNQGSEKIIDLIYNVPVGITLFYLSTRKDMLEFSIPRLSRVFQMTYRLLAADVTALRRLPAALLSALNRSRASRVWTPRDVENTIIPLHSQTAHSMESNPTEPLITPTVVSQTRC
ncbi:hypothetical protein DL96DRAFT_347591 [Flagelloscypha sp. PMI_526]|nr:hypothetical protein DL96DRAFT_347591 [Flagelloscypha sp. PMI_526]